MTDKEFDELFEEILRDQPNFKGNPEHFKILLQGVDVWNRWREDNPDIEPNLNAIDLTRELIKKTKIWDNKKKRVVFKGTNLTSVNFENANLSNIHFKNNVDIAKANLERVNITNIKYKERFLRYLWLQNSIKSFRGIRIETAYGHPRFKKLAQDMDHVEQFHNDHPWIYWLWKIFSNYGQSLSLWAGWSILFAVLFGAIFFGLGKDAFHVAELNWSLETMIYYSVVTFTTLGFGDIYPKTPEAARWVMAEVILGYVMLGGLISIFATKLARRS